METAGLAAAEDLESSSCFLRIAHGDGEVGKLGKGFDGSGLRRGKGGLRTQMERQRREDEVKNRSSKKTQDAEKSLMNKDQNHPGTGKNRSRTLKTVGRRM
ncbi:hypothetical protein GUJ93_ZPchr0458g22475 [Zizania palustris]|uniref:Uncharacterized protein n=1 Tax=Zizania palustris TaxID=103762 RepID=A0A8J5R0V1_ZIZPA|nr:hypothetical protein GUJ93_ZPchr0458g22475 [Zizania palustris]